MGLFSSKTKTYVSSVVYPLGNDDLDERTDFLKYTVLNSVLQKRSVGETITRSYLTGQGMQLRNAYKYARDHYRLGLPTAGYYYLSDPDRSVIQDVLQAKHGLPVVFINTLVTVANFHYWAEEYLTQNYGYDRTTGKLFYPPKDIETTAEVSFDVDSAGKITILLVNADGFTKEVRFKPPNMSGKKVYVHACYRTASTFPTEVTTETRETLPGETSGTSSGVTTVDREGELQETTTVITRQVHGDGTTTVTTQKSFRTLSRPKYLMYELGSGEHPLMDAWLTVPPSEIPEDGDLSRSPYYPAIPIRVDNKSITETVLGDRIFESGKKYAKRLGLDLDEIIEQVEDNEDIDEIDYCFVVPGVSLNTKAPEGKKYLFHFFDELIALSFVTREQFTEWEETQSLIDVRYNGIDTIPDDPTVTFPLGGGGDSGPPQNELRIADPVQTSQTYDMQLVWNFIEKTVVSGKIHADAKVGDVTVGVTAEQNLVLLGHEMTVSKDSLFLRRQITDNSYEQIEVNGLVHKNHVYRSKAVSITAHEAFFEEDEEGFLVPLNHKILVEHMSLKDVTQLSYDCLHLVFNCYQVVKKKWYQRGWFKVLLVVLAIVITVMTWGADGGSSLAAVMSMNAATALGFTGLMATYIAATFYVLTAMVLTQLLTGAANKAFGEEWGGVIAAITAVLVMNWDGVVSMLSDGLKLTAENILKATMATANLYGTYTQGKLAALDVPGQLEAMQEDYEEQMDAIEKLTKELLGTHTNLLDIQGMIEATAVHFESPQTFLDRTLLTGSDVCNITRGLIEDFAEVGLHLPTTP